MFIIFLAKLDHKDSHAKIKIHHFSTEWSSERREVLLDSLMEEFKLVVEKNEFKNVDEIIDNIFGISSLSRIRNKLTHELRIQGQARGKNYQKNETVPVKSNNRASRI